jgi:hypothetical protein
MADNEDDPQLAELEFWHIFFEEAGVPETHCGSYADVFVDNRITPGMLQDLTREILQVGALSLPPPPSFQNPYFQHPLATLIHFEVLRTVDEVGVGDSCVEGSIETVRREHLERNLQHRNLTANITAIPFGFAAPRVGLEELRVSCHSHNQRGFWSGVVVHACGGGGAFTFVVVLCYR